MIFTENLDLSDFKKFKTRFYYHLWQNSTYFQAYEAVESEYVLLYGSPMFKDYLEFKKLLDGN